MNLELNAQVQTWRRKAADGTLTKEEMRLAIAALRQGRVSASVASAKSKKAKAPINADDLLKELDGLM
jgi:hypothetical protein